MGNSNLIITDGLSRDQWLAKRRGYITGTRVPAILEVNPFQTPLQLQSEVLEGTTIKETGPMRAGTFMEPALLAMAQEYATGAIVKSDFMERRDRPLQGGQADGIEDKGGLGGDSRVCWEFKNVGLHRASDWGPHRPDEFSDDGDVPLHYLLQTRWYADLCEASEIAFGVLIGGQDFRVIRLEIDASKRAEMDEIYLECCSWWQKYIVEKQELPVDGSAFAGRMLQTRHPREKDDIVPVEALDGDSAALAEKLFALRKKRRALADEIDLLENRIKEKIGDRAGWAGDKWKITWKFREGRRVVDWDAIIHEAKVPSKLIDKHTRQSEGRRYFLPAARKGA